MNPDLAEKQLATIRERLRERARELEVRGKSVKERAQASVFAMNSGQSPRNCQPAASQSATEARTGCERK